MINFKHKKDETRFLHMHSLLLSIMFDMDFWCELRGLPFVITSTVSTDSEDKKLKRISSSHRTGRAFDISLRGWTHKDINLFRAEFNRKYEQYGAISKYTSKPTLIVWHNNGNGDHMHTQIHSKYSLDINLKPKKTKIERETLPLIAKQ